MGGAEQDVVPRDIHRRVCIYVCPISVIGTRRGHSSGWDFLPAEAHNVSYPFPKKLHMQINETKETFKMLTW